MSSLLLCRKRPLAAGAFRSSFVHFSGATEALHVDSRFLMRGPDECRNYQLCFPCNSIRSSLKEYHAFHTRMIPNRYLLDTRSFSSSMQSFEDDEDTQSTKSTPFLLADIGEGIFEVELTAWYVEPNTKISQFDRVCEVQSDKATVEITSRFDGTVLSLEHSVGDMVKVGKPLMYIATTEEERGHDTNSNSNVTMQEDEKLHIPTIASKFHFDSDDTSIHGQQENQQYRQPSDEDSSAIPTIGNSIYHSSKVLTSPAIRKLAKEHKLDLSTIVGTGPKGRVSKGDVLTVLKERGMVSSALKTALQSNPALPSTAAASQPSQATSVAESKDNKTVKFLDQIELPLQHDTVLSLRGYNRLMVSTMTASLQTPHMMYSDEINLNKFIHYKKEQSKESTHKLAFLPWCIKAASKALEKYPLLNASFDANNANQVTLWKDHNIGIAMDTPRGLIVPVLKHCQEKSIPELSEDLQRLKEAASQGSVPAEYLQGATFTLSNIGAIGSGGKYMCPIITAPQVAIGAIGKIERLPRFVGDTMQVEEAHICVISWGGDHRVVDGATMARFHSQWKEYMEDPMRLLMEMK